MLALQKFLQEALETINWIPSTKDFLTLAEWHDASMRTFTKDEEDLSVLLGRYSIVLNCGVDVENRSAFAGKIIYGPWGSAPTLPA